MPLHPKCGKEFPSGSQAGHCDSCCETFIGGNAFDSHRVGKHGTPERRCEIKPYESLNEAGAVTYGHWTDSRGFYHHGRKQTKEEVEARWSKSKDY